MATLLVANNRTEEIVGDLAGLGAVERKFAGCGAQRIVWFARDGDVVVVPWAPDPDYLDYVTMFTGVRRSSLRLVVPPPGCLGPHILSRDRLESPELQEAVRQEFAGGPVEDIFALCGDSAIACLARSLGAETAVAGYGFAASGGIRLVNFKSLFRAIAGGIGAPVPPGWVAYDQADACRIIARQLGEGSCVIVKQDLQSGGMGNEVLCPDTVCPDTGGCVAGAHDRAVVLNRRVSVRTYLARRWDWLTGGNRHAVVIERYLHDAIPVFAEFEINDQGPVFVGNAEMLMMPTYAGVIVPAPRLPPETEARLVEIGGQLCTPVWAMGYRGIASVDAVMIAENQLFFTEMNCRIGGSTHLRRVIGDRVIGRDYVRQRLLVERGGWPALSFREAVGRLDAEGLGYNYETRTGVLLVCDFGPADGTVRCCIVAEDLDAVRECEQFLGTVFPGAVAMVR